MNNLFDTSAGLIEAENILKNCFDTSTDKLHLISSINITEEDCKFLLDKLSILKTEQTPVLDYYKFKLCILVAWTFSSKYDISSASGKESFFLNLIKNVPQHHIRYYLEVLSSALDDFSIETFGLDFLSQYGLCKVMEIHSNKIVA